MFKHATQVKTFHPNSSLPFGEIVPDSVVNMLLYMSGSQHAPLEIRDAEFVLIRLKEHLEIFSRSIFYLGLPLGLLGAFSLTRMNKVFGHFMALIFATISLSIMSNYAWGIMSNQDAS